MKKTVLTLACAASLSIPVAHANLVSNGSFEAQSTGSSAFITLSGAGLTGWTITQGSVDLIGSYWLARDGQNSLDMNGNAVGAISQDIATVAGQQYSLTFSISGNPDDADKKKTMLLNIGNQVFTFDTSNIARPNNMGWVDKSVNFTAASPTTTLTFTSQTNSNGGYYGMALDNVAVVAVPEAETWAMMMAGLGLVGLQLRRKSKVAKQLSAD